jgi:tetratricopeptide (TPR) repeat protein
MKRPILLAIPLLALVAFAVGFFGFQSLHSGVAPSSPPMPEEPVGATLLEGLGDYSMPVHSGRPETQRWFDQGLMLTYGFNHDAAERSFLKAAEIDPDCAMCWWGAALVLGPHVNAGMDPANNSKAWRRLQQARALASGASEREQAYIEALSARYAEDPPENRKPLDEAYAAAMERLVRQFPDDLDAATLYSESLMNLQPWDYWSADGSAKGATSRVLSQLESVMARNPEHAGALHLYVHAVEASPNPEKGVAAADRLRDLIPASGHLVHMPAHIYARVGRYHDAVLANQKAISADDAYLAMCRPRPGVYPLGYVPHNHHFLWFAATMEGASATALEAAKATSTRTSDPRLIRTPGFEAMQVFSLTPLFARVRFARWQDVEGAPRPDADLPYMVAMWRYAQGIAAARQNRLDEAQRHHEALMAATRDPSIEKMLVWDRYSVVHGVRIAERLLNAELARQRKDFDTAVAAVKEAVSIEDSIPYDEPPGWHAPVRHSLGAVLLQAGKPAEAEAVFREELRRNPENGWSLYGLEQALRKQNRKKEAHAGGERFRRAWANADVELSLAML